MTEYERGRHDLAQELEMVQDDDNGAEENLRLVNEIIDEEVKGDQPSRIGGVKCSS